MSPFDLADLRGRLSARMPHRVPVEPPLREAAVALILIPHEHGFALLFIKRADHPRDPWSGQMALPGGRRDGRDPDLLTTAVRETEEETAIALGADRLVGELDDLSPVSPHLPPLIVRPFVFALPSAPPVRPSTEVAEHLWVPLPQLEDHFQRERVTVRDRSMVVPGYRIGPHFIWGMTERIVSPFLELLGR